MRARRVVLEKHGPRRRRAWRKLHIGIDADTGEILASELTASDVGDGSQVEPLLDQIMLHSSLSSVMEPTIRPASTA